MNHKSTVKTTKFSEHVARGRGSMLLGRRCNTLCASGFVDSVEFFYDWPYGGVTLPRQLHYHVLHGLTPLLHGRGLLVASSRRQQRAPRLDESFEQGVSGTGCAKYHLRVFSV